MLRLIVFAVALLAFVPTAADTADLTGRASVIHGDTLEIHGQRIQLFGIDAPESRQTCEADGQTYRCGQQAALALADHIGQRVVACDGEAIRQRLAGDCRDGFALDRALKSSKISNKVMACKPHLATVKWCCTDMH